MENNNWIPISSGIFPEDMEIVQVTYIGCFDKKPYCDSFAHMRDGIWYWWDNEMAGVEITAWKKNCKPYKAE